MKAKDIVLTKEMIDEVFEKAEQQADYIIGLYRIAFPDWDNIKRVNWPEISETTSLYIYDKAMKFDRKHHPNVLNGGAWMNNGFAVRQNMPDWIIDTSNCTVEY